MRTLSVRRLLQSVAQSSLTWFVVYVVIILLFARAYESWPGEFYHSTLALEPEYRREKHVLRLELQTALLDTTKVVKVVLPFGTGEARGWFSISDFEVGDDGKCTLSIGVPVLLDEPRGYFSLYYKLRFDANQFFAGREKRALLPAGDADRWIVNYEIEPIAPAGAAAEVVTGLIRTSGVITSWPTFAISGRVVDRIASFREATAGRSDQFPGGYWRAVYLSAVTITTLGYGDIVPLTRRARLAIALEAVVGIVVIGLYLHFLVQKAGGDRM